MDQIIGKNIIYIQETDSTNNYANREISTNMPEEGTVFLTYSQSGGRGQLNNKWESEPGKNLTFSILLKPHFIEIRKQFMISKVVSLGIYSVLSKYIDGVSIKWPNDIYVENKKICGILIENSIMSNVLSYSIAGIGINVNQSVFVSDAPNPVSMLNVSGIIYDLDLLLKEVLNRIDDYYKLLRQFEFKILDELFVNVLFQKGIKCKYKDDGGSFDGIIVGVNEIGQLMIQRDDKSISEYSFKEVEYIH